MVPGNIIKARMKYYLLFNLLFKLHEHIRTAIELVDCYSRCLLFYCDVLHFTLFIGQPFESRKYVIYSRLNF